MKTIIDRLRKYTDCALRRSRVPRDMPPAWAQEPESRNSWEDPSAKLRRVIAITMLLG